MANGTSLASGIVEIATGPTGGTGPTGPTGATGPTGPTGPLQLTIQDARYYASHTAVNITDNAFSSFANFMVATPIILGTTVTWTRIGANVTTANNPDTARLGIYTDTAGFPGTLLLDAGEISLSAAAEVEKTISQSLTANTWYWLAMGMMSEVAKFSGYPGDNFDGLSGYALGFDDGFGSIKNGVSGAQAYGALPASFPAISGYIGNSPFLWLRKGV